MNDHDPALSQDPATPPPGSPPPATGTAEGASAPSAADTCDLASRPDTAEELQAARQEVDRLRDAHMRALAELDNFRKRAARDMDAARKYAVENFARDLLAVADNMERAFTALNTGAESFDAQGPYKALLDGVTMIRNELDRVFARHGVVRMEAQGRAFDPNLHQAVMQQPAPDAAPGTILQVLQAGYTLNERLLRPAMVAVAAPSGGNENSSSGG
ncbi:MAG: nucleotide exchange factor GrpE [Magnetococcus sp. WYHC-3]